MSSNGRVAFVTGGGRGIGRAIAVALARAGAAVGVAGRTLDPLEAVVQEIRRMGGVAHAVRCDVTVAADVPAALDDTTRALGEIAILINNAGMAESAPLARLDESLWERTFAVNVTGTYRCTRAVLPEMVARGFGRIVNVASIAGKVGVPYVAAYCAAKHAVIGFTRAVALEVAAKGVTVNAVCPGYAETDMTTRSIKRIVETTKKAPEEVRRILEQMSPMRRLVRPEEIAAVVVVLASDEAAAVTGQAWNIDGGEVMS